MLPITIGTTLTSIGYICRFSRRNHINAWSWLFETIVRTVPTSFRLVSACRTTRLPTRALTAQFILCSPCAFLAQVYVLLPRIAKDLTAEHELPVRGRFIKIFYIHADVVTVLAQLAGTALTITFGKLVRIGHIVVTTGLWIQLACFLTFVGIFIAFWRRLYVAKHNLDVGGGSITDTQERAPILARLGWLEKPHRGPDAVRVSGNMLRPDVCESDKRSIPRPPGLTDRFAPSTEWPNIPPGE